MRGIGQRNRHDARDGGAFNDSVAWHGISSLFVAA
jgi:hypothetical protein